MITVRFPTGFSVQYNSARHVVWNPDGTTSLYEKADQVGFIARAPKDAVVEFVTPCRTYDASDQPKEVAAAFLRMLQERSSNFDYNMLRDIKHELSHYDATKRRWK